MAPLSVPLKTPTLLLLEITVKSLLLLPPTTLSPSTKVETPTANIFPSGLRVTPDPTFNVDTVETPSANTSPSELRVTPDPTFNVDTVVTPAN